MRLYFLDANNWVYGRTGKCGLEKQFIIDIKNAFIHYIGNRTEHILTMEKLQKLSAEFAVKYGGQSYFITPPNSWPGCFVMHRDGVSMIEVSYDSENHFINAVRCGKMTAELCGYVSITLAYIAESLLQRGRTFDIIFPHEFVEKGDTLHEMLVLMRVNGTEGEDRRVSLKDLSSSALALLEEL